MSQTDRKLLFNNSSNIAACLKWNTKSNITDSPSKVNNVVLIRNLRKSFNIRKKVITEIKNHPHQVIRHKKPSKKIRECDICYRHTSNNIKLKCGCYVHRFCLIKHIICKINLGKLDVAITCPLKNKPICNIPIPNLIVQKIILSKKYLTKYNNNKLSNVNTNNILITNYKYKICPTCTSQISRIDGCNHLTCSRCDTDFCYTCNQIYINGEQTCDCDYEEV